MAGPYTQDKRVGNFNTPLGKDQLVLRRFSGREGMSELFEYKMEAISVDPAPDFDRAIGQNCTLTMKTIDGGRRYFDGILTDVLLLDQSDEGTAFQLTLRPWLWLLSKRANSLIFHEKTAPEIISEIFQKHGGIAKFEAILSRSYPKLEYCVQYRESDMDFVRRLMEQHGISFHFRHEEGKHTLVMGDGMGAYQPIAGGARPFVGIEKRHQRETEHLFHWAPERRFTTGRVTLNDYDFKRPSANLEAPRKGDAKYTNPDLEVYDYPGKYVVEGEGKDYAQWRVDMERAADGHFHGTGDCLGCVPGGLMTLTNHPVKVHNRKYLILACNHSFGAETYRSISGDGEHTYKGSYEFMEASRQFAPPIVSPKPFLRGPQTAVVVGDGEIDCDEHGRIKVQFHWDREDDHSMRVRVAQVWASQQWGGIFIPRVGMEVIVDFLEGDPDRPIIIGCVYNGDNKPPYDLPDEKNIAGWKSNTTPDGGGYNEFIMDDTAGNELVRLHAQYDMDAKIEHDERRKVGNDRDTTIDNNDKLYVGNELEIEARNKITLKVGQSTIVKDQVSITISSVNISTKADAMASHTSDGPMTIKGLIININ